MVLSDLIWLFSKFNFYKWQSGSIINYKSFLSIFVSLLKDKSSKLTLRFKLDKIYLAPLSVILLFEKIHFYIKFAYFKPAPNAVMYLSPRWYPLTSTKLD